MKITRENYEPFFLDYLEGNLDEELMNDFIDFLRQNADLQEELQLFEPVALSAEDMIFRNKNKLLRSGFDDSTIFENAAIAMLEEDLSGEERRQFQQYLSENPDKQKEVRLFENTKLQADDSIIFARKGRLRKSSPRQLFAILSTSAAAVLLIALALWNLHPSDAPTRIDTPAMVENTEIGRKNITEPLPETKTTPEKTIGDNEPKPEKQEPVAPKKIGRPIPDQQKNEGKMLAATERTQRPMLHPLKSIPADNLSVSTGETGLTLAAVPMEFHPAYHDENNSHNAINTQFEFLSLDKIARSGMELLSGITKSDRIMYEKDQEGRITYIEVNTRLFSLSAPIKKK